ncbi:MAG: DUF4293 family protein [Brumimicrobium sp.]|nr:DUF4293 family protein [Brumimicrobium sp.]
MIQRIQSVYLLLTLLFLIILSVGTSVYTAKIQKEGTFEMIVYSNVYGVQKDLTMQNSLDTKDTEILQDKMLTSELFNNMKSIPTFYFPFYSITILLSMLAIIVLLGYKKLARQLKFGRLLFILNFLSVVSVLILYTYFKKSVSIEGESVTNSIQLGFGFYCIILSLAFSFLANLGINRDLKLVKSIDRIR